MEQEKKRCEGKKRDWVKKEDIPCGCGIIKGTANVDYLVSPYGEVYGHNLKTDKYYRISKWKDDYKYYRIDGIRVTIQTEYLRVTIYICGVRKKPFVHRLVAMFFCENDDPEHKKEADHLDGNPANNDYTNLEWVSNKENNQRRNKNRGWTELSEKEKSRHREAKRRAKNAHWMRKQRAQEVNLFNE